MNFQPQPRTEPVPQHPCMTCAIADLQGRSYTLTSPSEHRPSLTRPHQLTQQEISEHHNARPDRCLNQLQIIQLP